MPKTNNPDLDSMRGRLCEFMDRYVYPAEKKYREHIEDSDNPWTIPPIMEELKGRAKSAGLWNLWCPYADYGAGLNNASYAPLAEIMGRSLIGPEVFNCNAPDTGNMETLLRFGSEAHKEQWLKPLLAGEIRSAFCMTEPDVASSDATNIRSSIKRVGDEYIVDGRKWWSTGALDPRCEILIVMGKTDPNAERHQQQSIVLVPMDTPGVHIVRPMHVFGSDDAPHGHADIEFKNVRVPIDYMLAGEGKGFEIAQARLGPGRIHHCMRLIGCAQRALEMMCQRSNNRVAFGKLLSEQGSIREDIANSASEIEQGRLLTLAAAEKMDNEGNKAARNMIAMAKITVPAMAQQVIDRAIQIHGGMGVSQDTFLAEAWSYARTIRIADGPDQVHMHALAKQLITRYGS